MLKRNHLETSLTFKKGLLKHLIYLLEKKESKLILQYAQILPLKQPNGWFLTLICKHMKICKDRSLKNKWKIKKIKSQFKFINNMLKILFTQHLWRELSKLWKEWLFKMQMMKNLRITNIMKIILRIEKVVTLVQSYHFGVFQPKNLEKSTLLQFNGIQNTKIFLLSVTVLMISWNKVLV
jgi:hypothetical protein